MTNSKRWRQLWARFRPEQFVVDVETGFCYTALEAWQRFIPPSRIEAWGSFNRLPPEAFAGDLSNALDG